LTSFDVAAIVSELKESLKGARIQNIYQTRGKTLILKLHRPNQPALNLLIESGKRMHLTSYMLEKPEKPPAFCMLLRRHLRNSLIADVNQHEFERIIVLKARTKEGELKLVVELFGDGNIILVNSKESIMQALTFKRMRDRNILRGELFQHAPSSGRNPMSLMPEDLPELRKFGSLQVVKALTKFLSVGGSYAEEILLRAKVDKNKTCESLDNSDLESIHSAARTLVQPLESGKLKPRIIIDGDGGWVDAVPMELRKYEGLRHKEFGSFNEALDEFYAKTVAEQEVTVVTERFGEEVARLQRILEEQRRSLEEARQEAQRLRQIGDKIYANFHQLQALAKRIMDEKKDGKTWQEITAAIEAEKKRGETPSAYFQSLDTKKLALNVSVGSLPFSISLRDSVQKNAGRYYEGAKKAEKKVEGAKRAIEETLRHIERLRQSREVAEEQASKPFKTKKKAWYESFRWFYTSERLLVIGGKDAVSNEVLIKKHTEPHDLVFHADVQGAPFVVIKTEGKVPSQQSIEEAAQLAASHSSAWKAKFSAIDVYWVHPEQVNKTPPSGEYLAKGAFMIHGKKNYLRKTPLRLAVGIDVKATPLTVIGGPRGAVENKTEVFVEVVPGDLSSRELAGKIRQMLKQRVSKQLQEEVAKIPLEQIQAFIPYGRGTLSLDE
jgi:predicted ribosome quality control (RQC) complex YloA/Tae2 family protein